MDQCDAPFAGVADIDSPGVIVNYVCTAWYTILVACTTAILDNVQPREWVNSARMALRSCLRSLVVLQLITGITIVGAGLVQWDSLPFYHGALICNYWWLTLNSFWAARAVFTDQESYIFPLGSDKHKLPDDAPEEFESILRRTERVPGRKVCGLLVPDRILVFHHLSDKVRLAGISLSQILFIVYQIRVYNRETYHWDPVKTGFCYRYHDTTNSRMVWFWLVGLIITIIMLCSMLYDGSNDSAATVTSLWDSLLEKEKQLIQSCRDSQSQINQFDATGTVRMLFGYVLQMLAAMLLALTWLISQFISVFSWGPTWIGFEVVAMVGFATWNTYNVIDLKTSNLSLIQRNDREWGYGSVSALVVMVVGIVIGFADAYTVMQASRKKGVSRGSAQSQTA